MALRFIRASFARYPFTSPYFTKPADAVSDAVIAVLVLPEVAGAVWGLREAWAIWAWRSICWYYMAVVVIGS